MAFGPCGTVAAALDALKAAAREGGNVMPPSIAAAKAGVTTGEWGAAMREIFGEYRAPTGVGKAASAPRGNLAEVKDAKSIVGVTTNPAIFAAAMGSGNHYDEQLAELKQAGTTADAAVYAMSVKDVQDACDLFRDTYEATGGKDGRVSIEVDPRFAADEQKTIAQARELWQLVDRDNLMIKIPATDESLPAVTAAGLSAAGARAAGRGARPHARCE